MKSTNSLSPRSLCANRDLLHQIRWTLIIAVLSLSSVLPVRAAQQSFWPFNSFPPPAWSFSSTNQAVLFFPNLGSPGGELIRNFVITNLSDSILLPALSNSITYNANVTMYCQVSYDFGTNWSPHAGGGNISLFINHTNDAEGVRMFDTELMALDITLHRLDAPGGFSIRESVIFTSPGQLAVTTTNGGYLLSSFQNVSFEVSNGQGFWQQEASSAKAYLELSGPPGVPAILSVSLLSATNAMICWSTQTDGQYQLQRQNSVEGTNWMSVGTALPGNGSNVCVLEAIESGTNQFYRVQLSP